MALTPLTAMVAQGYHPFGYLLVPNVSQGLCCTTCDREYILLNNALQRAQKQYAI